MNPYWWIPIGIGSFVGLTYLVVAIALATFAVYLVTVIDEGPFQQRLMEGLGFTVQAFKWPAYAYTFWQV